MHNWHFRLWDVDCPSLPAFTGHVEACVRLSGDVGGSDWGQLQRRDPGAAHGFRQDEEPDHQTVEAPDWHPDPGELPGRAAQLRLQSRSG